MFRSLFRSLPEIIAAVFSESPKTAIVITIEHVVKPTIVQLDEWAREDKESSGLTDSNVICSTVAGMVCRLVCRGIRYVLEDVKSTKTAEIGCVGESVEPRHTDGRAHARERRRRDDGIPRELDNGTLTADTEVFRTINHYISSEHATADEINDFLNVPDVSSPAPANSPHGILRSRLAKSLSPLEREEVCGYNEIYYIGQGSNKNQATRNVLKNNFGYDNDRGEYIVVDHDHIAYRYEILGMLGKGAFGQVVKCRDHATGHIVAVKITRSDNYDEVWILEEINKYCLEGEERTVVKMQTHFQFRKHLCIVMDLMSMCMHQLIAANEFKGFSLTLIRRFAEQMFTSMALLRRHRIIHGDLKPSNILLCNSTKSAIQIADFGCSFFNHEKEVNMYIQTRHYRAPEIILGMDYDYSIDAWSVGCILAELYTGTPIFPGRNEREQLSHIMEVLGLPDESLLRRSRRKQSFFNHFSAPRHMIDSKGHIRWPGTKSLKGVLQCDDDLFLDLIFKLLTWDPERRLDPREAMNHPFMTAGRAKSTPPNPPPNEGEKKSTENPTKTNIKQTNASQLLRKILSQKRR